MNETVLVAIVGVAGVVVGSLLTSLFNYWTHRMAIQKEELRWERQQKAEKERRIAKEKKLLDEETRIRNQQVVDMYESCIRVLSVLNSTFIDGLTARSISIKEQLELRQEAFKWLSLLSFHLNKTGQSERENFTRTYWDFSEGSDNYNITNLMRSIVVKLSKSDTQLYPGLKIVDGKRGRRVQIGIDVNYRREQFENGTELPANYMFTCDLGELEAKHRIKIWEVFYSGSRVPDRLDLGLPAYNANSKSVTKSTGIWQAAINPLEKSHKDIFDAWVESYEAAWAEAYHQKESADAVQPTSEG